MKRAILLGTGALVAAIALPAALAFAQGFPPPPPTTYYGKVPAGITTAQSVIAIVTDGSISNACGAGTVTTDTQNGNQLVYVVDVVANAQRAGCGQTGRSVQFYFTPNGATSGRVATDSAPWGGPGPVLKDITTLGPPLNAAHVINPNLATDGVY